MDRNARITQLANALLVYRNGPNAAPSIQFTNAAFILAAEIIELREAIGIIAAELQLRPKP